MRILSSSGGTPAWRGQRQRWHQQARCAWRIMGQLQQTPTGREQSFATDACTFPPAPSPSAWPMHPELTTLCSSANPSPPRGFISWGWTTCTATARPSTGSPRRALKSAARSPCRQHECLGNTLTLDVPLMDSYGTPYFDGGHGEVETISHRPDGLRSVSRTSASRRSRRSP